jgi:hypothetical protein
MDAYNNGAAYACGCDTPTEEYPLVPCGKAQGERDWLSGRPSWLWGPAWHVPVAG